jgi:DNA repair exonuclease SbcCD ATPase subunit
MIEQQLLKDRKFTKVYHISDIHIRNLKRHKEYRKVLNQFLENVKKDGLKDALIYIGGDVAHAKTEMSPELVREVSWFLDSCANLLPTILIAGNHDANINNPSRLDVLTPIVDSLNNPNLLYFRDTGIYTVGDLTFGVYSIFSHKDEWPTGSDVMGKHKICLFHGPVDRAQTNVGYTVSSSKFRVDMFDGWHIAMLGDIHKRQVLQEYDEKLGKPIIAYSSSAIQQNHGEFIEGHGYLLWDVPKRTFTEVDLSNEYGYVTIDIVDNEIPKWVYDEINNKLPKYPKIRARFTNTSNTDIKERVIELNKLFQSPEITVTRTDTIGQLKSNNRANHGLVGNVKDIVVQNNLLKDYLERTFYLDNETIAKVLEINGEVNSSLINNDGTGNIVWIPKSFEFSNMFSYGENNKVDFTKANGIVGVFAPNASGKSSIFSALSFCIFDKSDRAFKAQHIMNNQKNEFYCKFGFEIDGVDYYIERLAQRQKNGNVKVDVNFWKESGDMVESLNGEQRRETNLIIEQYVGKYEDFVLTALSVQGNNSLFIDKSQSERKDILSQFIGVDIFDKLYNVASELNKETSTLIRKFKNDNFEQDLIDLRNNLSLKEVEYKGVESELKNLHKQKDDLDDSILKNTSKLIKLNEDIVDIDVLSKQQLQVKQNLLNLYNEKTEINDKLEKLTNLYKNIQNLIDDEKYRNLDELRTEYNKKVLEVKDVEHTIDKLNIQLQSSEERLSHLEEHEYNENCDICLKNSKSVIESKETIGNTIKELKQNIKFAKKNYETLQSQLNNYGNLDELWSEYSDLKKKLERINKEIITTKDNKSSTDTKLLKEGNLSEKLTEQIENYYKYEVDYKHNVEVNGNITKLKSEVETTRKSIRNVEQMQLSLNGQISTIQNQVQQLEDRIDEVKQLEEKYRLYEYYLDAVKRDGISYELITKVIPAIEGEVNNILGQMVDFGIQLEMDGKNINALLTYDDQQWALEMSSGMERFISGLAIRVALINICNLPRPNFLVVDEGFGVMDSDNMSSINLMLNYLKTQFDFIMIISHIDSMRDVVDQLMEIKKIEDHSHVKF